MRKHQTKSVNALVTESIEQETCAMHWWLLVVHGVGGHWCLSALVAECSCCWYVWRQYVIHVLRATLYVWYIRKQHRQFTHGTLQ